MKRFVLGSLLFLWALIALSAELPQKVASIEGVTEYRLPNGLKVLTIPVPGAVFFRVTGHRKVSASQAAMSSALGLSRPPVTVAERAGSWGGWSK